MTLPDRLMAAQRGDPDGFRALVAPLLEAAYRTAFLILLDRELAHDAVQEALLRAHRYVGRLKPDDPFAAWFTRILVNEARRLARRQWRQPALLANLPEIADDLADSPEGRLLAKEERERLWSALGALDELHRTVLVLRYYQGMTEPAIAAALDLKLGTVKSRLHNGRRHLQERLQQEQEQRSWGSRMLDRLQRRFS